MKKTMIRFLTFGLIFPAALFLCACKDRETQTPESESRSESLKVSEAETEPAEPYPDETGPEVPVVLSVAETALIPEHPFLKDTPFFDACLGDAMPEEPVEEYPSEDLGEGTIRFYKG